ncbi:MAG TPA: (2Fe-2S)-binding protein [Pirellulaceae bacterium]|nr:(2Fe-2S)-binding protein [Pirellulaceae bacterium]HMO94181.1 (2Fe-2S)-binding protein [Pirellulaceae bacterium]HMP71198.1 (2Fe-2S)-binding protein [Pirellulaceae bacterium]
MQIDDHICLCFKVTQRKIINYIRVEKPKVAAQLSDCFGAGTGCGWCRPFLQALFDQYSQRYELEDSSDENRLASSASDSLQIGSDTYAAQRKNYLRETRGSVDVNSTEDSEDKLG